MRSRIARRMLTQYIVSLLVFMVVLFGGYFFAWFICTQFVWEKNDPLYDLLKMLQALSPVLIVAALLAGWVLLTRHYISKPLRYLDEVIEAAEQLSHPSSEPITLSPAMYDVQNQLNLAREEALRNARAAKEAEQRKNDLIVYLAHDLKTPLTSVIGYLTLLREEPQISPELRARYVGIALDKAERLEELMNEFFDITRWNLTAMTLDMEKVNLSRMTEQMVSEFDPILAEKGLTWSVRIQPNVELVCDPNKLGRVFDNLLRNAVNYSYPNTPIQLSMEQKGGLAEIRICNSGKTIAPEKLDRIFEQFFRLDPSRSSSTGGAGLGLAIAKEIVETHGGTLTVQSADEQILFTVRLPLCCQKIV